MHSTPIVRCTAALSFLFALASGHPTYYPHVKVNKTSLRWNADEEPPPVLSWHIHITYFLTNPDSIQGALDLRARAADWFSPYLGEECDGRYDYGVLCMINDHDFANETLAGGPFPVGEWSIFIPVPYYALVVPWMLQHRGDFSMIVHPNTGYEYEDHSIWAQWAGLPQPLDMSIFEANTQTNEFGQWRGNTGNPTCMAAPAVCGSEKAAYNASTTIFCCPGLTCVCTDNGSADDLCRCSS